jgi:hypothetical protein
MLSENPLLGTLGFMLLATRRRVWLKTSGLFNLVVCFQNCGGGLLIFCTLMRWLDDREEEKRQLASLEVKTSECVAIFWHADD